MTNRPSRLTEQDRLSSSPLPLEITIDGDEVWIFQYATWDADNGGSAITLKLKELPGLIGNLVDILSITRAATHH